MRLPKKIATLLTITLVATNVGNTTFADTIQRVSSENLIGEGRWETAIEVSKKGWTSSDEAIIVNDNSIVDALSATPFAEAKNAPILLTQKDKLDEKTKAELKRLGVKKVYIIGGENTLTKNVETELKSHNIQTDRIQGATRELTSLEVAKRLDAIKPISEIAVVNGTTGLADAVSIAAVAAKKDMAIILSNPNEGTKASDEFIKSKNISTSYVIGGKNSISKDVENKLPNAKRIEGIDRNETNAKVIETFYTEKEIKNAYVSKDGMGKEDHLIDALSVGVLAAKNDSPVIIVGNKLNQMQKDVTNTKSFDTVTQVGGSGNETAFDELKTMQGITVYEVKTVAELNNALAKADANDIINVRSLTDNTKSNDVVEIKSNNNITVNLYDNTKSFVENMDNGTLVVHTNLSSVDVKSGNLVIKGSVSTVNVLEGASVTINNEATSKPNVTVAEGASVDVDGKINTITVNGKDAQVNVSKDSTITKVEVSKDATGTVIENAGKVNSVVSNAPNVTVENNGTVGNVSGTNKPTVEGTPVTPPSNGGGSSSPSPSPSPSKTQISGVSIEDATPEAIDVGDVLSAKLSPENATVSYQWMISDRIDGTYTNIQNATTSTYTVTSEDIGKYIKVEVEGTDNYTGTKISEATKIPKTEIIQTGITFRNEIDGSDDSGQVIVVGYNTITLTFNKEISVNDNDKLKEIKVKQGDKELSIKNTTISEDKCKINIQLRADQINESNGNISIEYNGEFLETSGGEVIPEFKKILNVNYASLQSNTTTMIAGQSYDFYIKNSKMDKDINKTDFEWSIEGVNEGQNLSDITISNGTLNIPQNVKSQQIIVKASKEINNEIIELKRYVNIKAYNGQIKVNKTIDLNSTDKNQIFGDRTKFNIYLNRDEDLGNIILDNNKYTTYDVSGIHMYGIDEYSKNPGKYTQLQSNYNNDKINRAFGNLSLNSKGCTIDSENTISANIDMQTLREELLKILQEKEDIYAKYLKEIAILVDLKDNSSNTKQIVIQMHLN